MQYVNKIFLNCLLITAQCTKSSEPNNQKDAGDEIEQLLNQARNEYSFGNVPTLQNIGASSDASSSPVESDGIFSPSSRQIPHGVQSFYPAFFSNFPIDKEADVSKMSDLARVMQALNIVSANQIAMHNKLDSIARKMARLECRMWHLESGFDYLNSHVGNSINSMQQSSYHASSVSSLALSPETSPLQSSVSPKVQVSRRRRKVKDDLKKLHSSGRTWSDVIKNNHGKSNDIQTSPTNNNQDGKNKSTD